MATKLIKTGAKATGEKWKDDYQTPSYILEAVNEFYGGRNEWLDPCPPRILRPVSIDAFWLHPSSTWLNKRKMYINPPFSKYLKFVQHLLPLGGEQIWIMHHDSSTERQRLLMERARLVCLLNERVRFIDPRTGEVSKGTEVGKSQTLIYLSDEHDMQRVNDFILCFRPLGKVLEPM